MISPRCKMRRALRMESLETRQLLAADVRITEFAASNSDALLDGDGNSPDWIEIENQGDANADLNGWFLTDSAEELTKWPFPAIQLAPSEFLVVFASAPDDGFGGVLSDYVDAGGNLHTNFQLRSAGEFVGLVDNNGPTPELVSQFEFGQQRTDVSFGAGRLTTDESTLIGPQTAATYFVPSDALTGPWRGDAEPFDDSAAAGWLTGAAAIGYDNLAGEPGDPDALALLHDYDAADESSTTSTWPDLSDGNNWTLAGVFLDEDIASPNTSITRAYNLGGVGGIGVGGDATPFPAGNLTYEIWARPGELEAGHQVLFETGGGQNGTSVLMTESHVRLLNSSGNARSFDISVPLDDIDTSDFLQIAAVLDTTDGRIDLSVRGSAGGIASASAGGVVGRGGNRASLFSWGSGLGNMGNPADQGGGTFNLGGRTELPGMTPAGLTQFQGDIARLNVYSAALTSEQLSQAFQGSNVSPTLDYTDLIETDIESQMFSINGSAYLRIPFEVSAEESFGELLLRMQYDDGFVAYLNGVEVARSNVDGTPPVFDAVATQDRDDTKAVSSESFDLTDHLDLLLAGQTNILAIHGLNSAPDDSDFLIRPELLGINGNELESLYFSEPTPRLANTTTGYFGFVTDTTFDFDRGVYSEPIEVTVSTSTPEARIYYTTDGTAPGPDNGTLLTTTVSVSTTTTLRAAAFRDNYIPTNVDTHTYLYLEDVVGQPNDPVGYPATWAGVPADYEMDPDVVGPNNLFDDLYRDTIVEDLKSLPTLSVVMNPDDLFGSEGIYVNPEATGDLWERPTSVELIVPDGSEPGFQIDSGIRVQGGSSRNVNFPKHSMRLEFRSKYGDSRLNYPLFDNQPSSDSAVGTFDEVVLRASFNNSWTHWHFDQAELAQQQRDQWARDIQEAMDQPTTHGRYVHLYLNGMYWGIYNMGERPAAPYQSDYHGGSEDDWDVLNGEGSVVAVDGDKVAWNAMWSIANRGLGDQANYEEILNHIDVENIADYIIMNFYFGNEDWDGHNWMAARQRSPAGRWQFYAWDTEFAIGLRPSNHATGEDAQNQIINIDRTGLNTGNKVTGLHQRLAANEEYRLLFADLLQEHFFNDGVLTPESVTQLWNARATQLDRAMIAESARWGDYRRDVHSNQWPMANFQLYTYEDHYLPIQDFILNEYFPVRSDIALGQMAARGLFPTIGAPKYQINGSDQHGGLISSGDVLSMSGGTAIATTEMPLVTIDAVAMAFVPDDDSLEIGAGPRWYDTDYDAVTWISGSNGVGYDTTQDYDDLIGTDVLDAWNANPTSVYSRFEFELDANFDPDVVEGLELRMKYDDGYVVYLNGQLVHSQNSPTPAVWNSRATAKRLDLLNTVPTIVETTDLLTSLDLLQPGQNVLAIHVLNHASDLSDILARPELVLIDEEEIQAPIYYTLDGSDPREIGGAPVGVMYDGTIPLADTTEVNARALLNGEWSALSRTTFVVGESGSKVAVTEINYNPPAPTAAELTALPGAESDSFEFLEVTNTSTSESVSLVGMQFVDGVTFAFGNESLPPGESAVVVENVTAFQLRYGTSIRVLGQWSGGLSAGGETLRLADAAGEILMAVSYDDAIPWPASADGAGASLELVNPTNTTAAQYSKPYSWRGSTDFGGSPAAVGTAPLGVVVNEVLTHADPPSAASDAIELWNSTNQTIDIGGWFLSDSATTLLKYEIPSGTILAAREYIVFDESDFNPTPLDPGANDFALSGTRGDDVWLVVPDGLGGVRYIADDAHFGAALNGVSFGRVDRDLVGNEDRRVVPLSTSSLGCENGHPLVGPLVISEVNYSPAEPSDSALAIYPDMTANDLEFVEVHNPTVETVDLAAWRIRGGVDFEFDSGTTIDPGATLVITRFNPAALENADRVAAFRIHYGINETVPLVGGYGGTLRDGGERITLQRADVPSLDDPTFTPHVVEDEVIYDNLSPWPRAAGDDSLGRLTPVSYGNSSNSWTVGAASPGITTFVEGLPGDLTGNGVVSADDIDLLNAVIRRGTSVTSYDLDGNGTVNAADRVFMVENIIGTFMGDTNLDGQVNAADLNVLGINWQRMDDCLTWKDGDFDGNDIVDAADLNAVGVNWLAAAAQARVPRAPLAARAVDVSLTELTANEHPEAKSVHGVEKNGVEKNDEIANVGLNRTRWQRAIERRNDLHSGRAQVVERDAGELESLDIFWSEWRGRRW